MPYLTCPGCRLSLYSAASHSWIVDSCPSCGASLEGASKQVGTRTFRREFPSTPSAIVGARRALDGLRVELGEQLHTTAEVLVGELVSNSVRHSNASNGVIELVACVTPTVVRVEVSDDHAPVPNDGDEPARGLELVEKLADRWGRPTSLGESVWLELDREAAPVAARDARAAT